MNVNKIKARLNNIEAAAINFVPTKGLVRSGGKIAEKGELNALLDVFAKPTDDFIRILVRRKYRIENVLNQSIADNKSQPFDQGHSFDFKGRKRQGFGESQLLIAQ